MLNLVLEQIKNVRLFLIVSAVGTLVFGIVFGLVCRQFDWTGKRTRFIAFFFNMTGWDTFGIAVSLIKIFLALAIVIDLGKLSYIHIALYVALEFLYILHRRTIKGLPMHLAIGLVTTGLMILMVMLNGYLTDVIFDYRVKVTVILLSVIMLINSAGDFFRCMNLVVSRGIERNRKEYVEEQQNGQIGA